MILVANRHRSPVKEPIQTESSTKRNNAMVKCRYGTVTKVCCEEENQTKVFMSDQARLSRSARGPQEQRLCPRFGGVELMGTSRRLTDIQGETCGHKKALITPKVGSPADPTVQQGSYSSSPTSSGGTLDKNSTKALS